MRLDWRMGDLRWRIFQAALAADGANPRLAALLARDASALPPVRPLAADDRVETFDCGVAELDAGLRRDAAEVGLVSEDARGAWVAIDDGQVVAYYATRWRRLINAAQPTAAETPLLLVRRLALDRRWRRGRPEAAADLFAHLLHEVISWPAPRRPAAIVAFALTPATRRCFLRWGARPIAEMVNPRSIMMSMADIERARHVRP